MFQHKYKYGFIAFIIVYSFLNIIVLNGDRLFKIQLPGEYLLAVITFLCFGLWFINLFIERFILPKVQGIHPLIGQFVFSLVGICVLAILAITLASTILGSPFSFNFKNITLTGAFLFRVNLFLNTINAVVFFNKKYKEKELETEKMHLASLSARYEVLNNQINPHFLFNSLNTLSSLLTLDIKKAEEFLQKLAETYRYVLKNRDNELVSISEELEFINGYAELLNIRFQNALLIKIAVSAECSQYFIPPTVLQLLIENVVKHNQFTEKQPVEVLIENSEDKISVSNSIRLKNENGYSSGIGLSNISERYLFFNEKICIHKTDQIFRVDLPFIEMHEKAKINV